MSRTPSSTKLEDKSKKPREKKRRLGVSSDIIAKLQAAKKAKGAWAEPGVIIEQAARSVDLLFFNGYVTLNETRDRWQFDYIKMINESVGKLLNGWAARRHLLEAPDKFYSSQCPMCMVAIDIVTENPTPNCPGCNLPKPTLHRVIWVAAYYTHKLLMAGTLFKRNLDVFLTACLLLSLKVQMPMNITWGVGLTIQLVTGEAPCCEENREFYTAMREEVIRAEQKVMQLVGERNIRCLLPMDHLAEGVGLLYPSWEGNWIITENEIVREHRRRLVYQRAARLCGEAFYTPLMGSCDVKEVAFGMVWLAWRTSCRSVEELEAGEDTVLTKLSLKTSIEGMLQPSPTSVKSLLDFGILSHGERLFLTGTDHPQATLHYTMSTVQYQTDSKIHTSLVSLTKATEKGQQFIGYSELALLGEWKVRRGECLFKLSEMHLGWPRKKRKEILKELLGVETTATLPFEVLYWMVHYWVSTGNSALLGFLRPEAFTPASYCLKQILQKYLTTSPLVAPLAPYLSHPQHLLTTASWEVRTHPRSESAIVTTIPPATRVQCIGTFGKWYHVKVGSQLGWGFDDRYIRLSE
eukprot:TRINITY_DN13504_c0_g1_i1.p1 TRINITY_DN13504_c0_g1~~TRINITY_DN13504_c0_g1_i1.p1  ORF type:complete len:593 (+),score=96.32 TRINITY_DN13504_c0_g1_i1:44-1780(+)